MYFILTISFLLHVVPCGCDSTLSHGRKKRCDGIRVCLRWNLCLSLMYIHNENKKVWFTVWNRIPTCRKIPHFEKWEESPSTQKTILEIRFSSHIFARQRFIQLNTHTLSPPTIVQLIDGHWGLDTWPLYSNRQVYNKPFVLLRLGYIWQDTLVVAPCQPIWHKEKRHCFQSLVFCHSFV